MKKSCETVFLIIRVNQKVTNLKNEFLNHKRLDNFWPFWVLFGELFRCLKSEQTISQYNSSA